MDRVRTAESGDAADRSRRAELGVAGWGTDAPSVRLSGSAGKWLSRRIGWTPRSTPAVPIDTDALPAGQLPDSVRSLLVDLLGGERVRLDGPTRLAHSGGRSYLDLLRRRAGEVSGLPDAVLRPATHDDVASILAICAEQDIAVVPVGGGTSVVGGLSGGAGEHRAILAIDLGDLDQVTAVDPKSLLVTAGPGLRGPEFEDRIARYGLTLGHFPQSFEFGTLGGYAATRSAGQASTGYGRFDELVVAARLATPVGTWQIGRAPASAAGPDLLGLVVGSEGTLGVITELTLRVHPVPEERHYEGWSFRSLPRAVEGMRQLARAGLLPDIARVSDPDESRANLALAGGSKAAALQTLLRARGHRGGCLVVVGWEGAADTVGIRRRAGSAVLRSAEGLRLGRALGGSWAHNRYSAPYLRDTMLDNGLLVETLETAATWSELDDVYSATRAALTTALGTGTRLPLVMCHLSHVYPTGASLYFTVLADREDDRAFQQWLTAKRAATDALLGAGGVLTHHHAVGTDHAPWLEREIGDLGVEVLRAVKDRLDPTGICNPGVLLGRSG